MLRAFAGGGGSWPEGACEEGAPLDGARVAGGVVVSDVEGAGLDEDGAVDGAEGVVVSDTDGAGVVKDGVLGVAEAAPTPSVNAMPRDAAIAILRALRCNRRNLYSVSCSIGKIANIDVTTRTLSCAVSSLDHSFPKPAEPAPNAVSAIRSPRREAVRVIPKRF